MDSEKLSKIALECVLFMLKSGASFEEGQAILTCALALMKQVDRTPEMDDEAIARMAMGIIATELSIEKTSQA
jgi:hypothetical protein